MIEPVQTRETLDRAIADDHEAAHLRGQLDQLRAESGVAREELARPAQPPRLTGLTTSA
jgi:hypothetical protein